MTKHLFTVMDPLENVISLTPESFKRHILVAHPDMSDMEEIAITLEQPDHVAQDATNRHRLIYYRSYKKQPARWFKVVTESGEVITAYRVGRIKRGEQILWPQ